MELKAEPTGQESSDAIGLEVPAEQAQEEEEAGPAEGAAAPLEAAKKDALAALANAFKNGGTDVNAPEADDLRGSIALAKQIAVVAHATDARDIPTLHGCVEREAPKLDNALTCMLCGSECAREDSSDMKSRCRKCNSVRVKLYKHYGKWPTDDFRTIDRDEQKVFYNRVKDKGSSREIVQCCEDSVTRKHSETNSSLDDGEFLPLSVYETQGFDTSVIKAKAESQEHPVLGTCYRVNIRKTRHATTDSTVREQRVLSRKQESSTSSSSSSTDDKKKKKKKKKKNDKKKGNKGKAKAKSKAKGKQKK